MKRSATAILLVLLITLPVFAQGIGNRRELIRAEYGWGNSWVDVTETVRSLIRNDSLNFRADNATLGFDPARGRDKTLRVYLRNRQGRIQVLTFREDSNVRVRRVYGGFQGGRYHDRRLEILRATYGYGNRAFDVTNRLQRQIRNDQLSLRVTNNTMGGDPAVGRDKTLTVLHSFNGRISEVSVREGDYLRLPDSSVGYQGGRYPDGDGRYYEDGRLEIQRATYGYGNRSFDVTNRLQRQIRNDQLSLRVTNDSMGGDPAVGRDKTLTVLHSYRGRTGEMVVREGEYLRLPDINVAYEDGRYPDGDGRYQYGRLEILRATYGYGSRSFDVTNRLQQQIRNDQLTLRVTNDTMGGDPAVGRDKTLTVLHSYRGRTGEMVVREGEYLRLPDASIGYQGSSRIIPRGAELAIRTNEAIDSRSARVGQTFSAVMERDVQDDAGRVAVLRHSDVELVIRSTEGSDLVLDIDSLMVGGERYYVSTEDVQRGGRSGRRAAVMIGGGAVAGAVIGAILGGGKGAAIGAGVGAGAGALGTVLTGGKEVRVPPETVLTFRLDQDLRLEQWGN